MANPDPVDDHRTVLTERLRATRERTLGLFAPLPHEHLVGQPSAFLSPPLWDLGHIAAKRELWLARRLAGRPSLHPALEDVYDAFGTPRGVRGDAPILGEDEAHAYLSAVRETSLDVLGGCDLDADDPLTVAGFVFDMVAQHEAQHTETVLQAFQLLPAGSYAPPARRALPPGDAVTGWVEVPGGPFEMGPPPADSSTDCERPRHVRETAPVLMAATR